MADHRVQSSVVRVQKRDRDGLYSDIDAPIESLGFLVGDAGQVRTFKDLKVWQKAHKLALLVYRETAGFPKEELYGLTSQMRRAAVSTAANIVEGSRRRTRHDFGHFLNIAQGSNEEVKYYLLLAQDLGLLASERASVLAELAEEVGAMLHVIAKNLIEK